MARPALPRSSHPSQEFTGGDALAAAFAPWLFKWNIFLPRAARSLSVLEAPVPFPQEPTELTRRRERDCAAKLFLPPSPLKC